MPLWVVWLLLLYLAAWPRLKVIYSSHRGSSCGLPLLGFLIWDCLDKSWTQSTHFVLLSGDPVTAFQTRRGPQAGPLGARCLAAWLGASSTSSIWYMRTPLTSLSGLFVLWWCKIMSWCKNSDIATPLPFIPVTNQRKYTSGSNSASGFPKSLWLLKRYTS